MWTKTKKEIVLTAVAYTIRKYSWQTRIYRDGQEGQLFLYTLLSALITDIYGFDDQIYEAIIKLEVFKFDQKGRK